MAGKPAKHLVHGEWMTIYEAEARLRISRHTINKWRATHRRPNGRPGLLLEAWDWYAGVKAGRIKRWMGRPTTRHRVDGRRMSRNEAAEELHMPVGTLDSFMHSHRCGLDAAFRHYSEKRQREAEKKILEIINEARR